MNHLITNLSLPQIYHLRQWSLLQQNIRNYFTKEGFLEIQTSYLVPEGAFENTLDPLTVSSIRGNIELHTSPEIEMKKLLGIFKIPIFQIARCFRDDPHTEFHHIEFTMLEFYRVNDSFKTIQKDVCNLLNYLTGRELKYNRITVNELFLKHTKLDLRECLTLVKFKNKINELQLIAINANDSWQDLFFKIMIEKIEPFLSTQNPLIVENYPNQIAALAKLNPITKEADKFEIYWHGRELCNGCTELDDIEELKLRFSEEKRLRTLEGKTPHSFPNTLLEAMKTMPPSAGVAVGVDRLFQCLTIENNH